MLERVKKYLSVLELSNCSDAISFQHSKADFLFYNIMEKEIWKEIEGYNGHYQVSNHGRIKSFKRNANGDILKTPANNRGYSQAYLCLPGIEKSYNAHVIVAKTFLANPHSKPCVNHIDGNKRNNHINNLEWVTHKENTAHAFATGLNKANYGARKLTELSVKEIRYLHRYNAKSMKELSKIYGVTTQTIWKIIERLSWKHID